MTPADLLGGAILASVACYALLGGADFGGGVWDLLATGPRARHQRTLVEHALGPIWEANHVWLVLVVVVLFTGFPPAFAAISEALFAPLVLLLVGIVLRGAAFTFRAYDRPDDAVQRRWGWIFSMASVIAPLMLGTSVGALASGRVRVEEGIAAAPRLAWVAGFPLVVGAFTAALFAFLAATYLCVEAAPADPGEAGRPGGGLADDFRTRAVLAGIAVFLLALAAAVLSRRQAPLVYRGLTARPWSLPLHLATGAAAVAAFAGLLARRYRAARLAAAAQVALIVVGWGASQYPYLVVPDLTLESASAPRATQVALLWALGGGALLLFPSLWLLFRVFKGERPFSAMDRPRR